MRHPPSQQQDGSKAPDENHVDFAAQQIIAQCRSLGHGRSVEAAEVEGERRSRAGLDIGGFLYALELFLELGGGFKMGAEIHGLHVPAAAAQRDPAAQRDLRQQ